MKSDDAHREKGRVGGAGLPAAATTREEFHAEPGESYAVLTPWRLRSPAEVRARAAQDAHRRRRSSPSSPPSSSRSSSRGLITKNNDDDDRDARERCYITVHNVFYYNYFFPLITMLRTIIVMVIISAVRHVIQAAVPPVYLGRGNKKKKK